MKRDNDRTDRLMDALLREDAKGGADEKFLAAVERAIEDGEVLTASRAGRAGRRGRGWWARAAVLAISGIGVWALVMLNQAGKDSDATAGTASAQPDFQRLAAVESERLQKQIREQEDRVEEKRKLFHSAVRAVAIPYIEGRPGLMGYVEQGGVMSESMVERRGGFPAPNVDGRFDSEAAPVDRERYGQLVDQPWKAPWQDPLSTFSVDVDTASYTNIRRMLRSGEVIPRDAVRIEECVNYFDYAYPAPQNGGPFAVHVEIAGCPWEPRHHLVKIGLKGREVDSNTRPPSNLVFLIDVSGSMNEPNKLPLLVESMKVLVEELDERDAVGIVVYAGSAGTVLEPTKVVGEGRTGILRALDSLRAGGSTAGAAGIAGAYELAARNYLKDGVNRVILATDGDFNVGTSSDGALVDLVKEKAKGGIFLSVLGFGTGNLNDGMMEAITNDGNGNYYYIDSQRESRKVFLQNLSGTLVTIAKDVKIQVEFNPGKVAAYRLIGYANRILPPEAFNDDRVDAGEIGAGHTVTALYEIVPVGVEAPVIGGVNPLKYQQPANRAAVESPEWMTVKLRYKAPDGDTSQLLELPVQDAPLDWRNASADYQFAAGVALFGEKLRGSEMIGEAAWELVTELAQRGSARDPHGHRAEFRELVQMAGRLPISVPERESTPVPQGVEAPPAP